MTEESDSPFFKLMQKAAKKQAKDNRIKFVARDGEILYYERVRGALHRVSA